MVIRHSTANSDQILSSPLNVRRTINIPALLATSLSSSIDKNFNLIFHKLIDSYYLWLPNVNYIVF